MERRLVLFLAAPRREPSLAPELRRLLAFFFFLLTDRLPNGADPAGFFRGLLPASERRRPSPSLVVEDVSTLETRRDADFLLVLFLRLVAEVARRVFLGGCCSPEAACLSARNS